MRADECGPHVVRQAVDALGGIDLLVNNAAAFDYVDPEKVQRADWIGLFTLKTVGYWSLATAAVPELARRRGAIVNVSGVAGVAASPGNPHVGAANAAVVSMTESLALALAPQGIRVSAVTPGSVDTDRFRTVVSTHAREHGIDESAARERLSNEIPVGHPVDPAEVALAIAVLGSPLMRSVTGAHLIVDGGSTLARRRRS
jgi:NAD(P)-dependent dehydrogenase (short-subunit alcohol dehydrogenase family)